ncbi:hypothetical protein HOLleu_03074 [Holothuria leucospilota]|uniref:DDE Tnp4 domain-containing protein n=1 Tax=Holothuria leucospilota TaxID=206669 RepID=A0A9Q1HLN3_HOLLE|nr:hypothetical protein HOLleu_03074 [Holothuria leucospilota]
MVIFNHILPHLNTFLSIDPFKKLLLTLICLRFNVALTYLALTFGVSVPTPSRVFTHCIDIMYVHLVPLLVFWPDLTLLRKSLPLSFCSTAFQKCMCIIDCFEIFIDRPSNLKARAQTYSSYKSPNTMKYLIRITPQGSVSFISLGWGGRTSDKFITENSGFLNCVQPGDVILADRGFDMHDTFGVCQAQLKIPAFTKGKKQLDPLDVENTRGLAAVRIHVERVIGTVRQKYSILRGPISMSFLECATDDVMPLDKIVHICCALTNVCHSVVPAD